VCYSYDVDCDLIVQNILSLDVFAFTDRFCRDRGELRRWLAQKRLDPEVGSPQCLIQWLSSIPLISVSLQ